MRRMMASGCVVLLWAGICFGGTVTVTGRVVDFQARPVADAEIAVVENGLDWRTQLQDARVCGPIARTDDQGLFEAEARVEFKREMFVVARKPGLAFAWDKAPMDVASAPQIEFHLVMEKPQSLSGVVVDSSGRAMVGATVRAVPKTGYLSTLAQSPISLPEPWLSTMTDAEGRFRFDAFSADVICDFWVRAEGYACVHTFTTNHLPGLGYEVGRSDIRLTLPLEHRVQGRVVEQGTDNPVPNVDLQISPPDSRREDIKDQYLGYPVRSDANGVFVFPGVPEGEHEIDLAYPERGVPTWIIESTRVVVGTKSVEGLTVEAVKGGVVEILVRDAKTRQPIPGICVSLPNFSVSRLPYTDSHGVARACVRPGESRALISSGAGRNRQYQSWGIHGVNDRFFVIRGETTRLEVDLEPANRIRGLVVDPNAKAIAGTTVKIHPLGTGSRIISNVGDTLRTDSQGRFELACGEADPVGWYVTACCQERGWAGIAEVTSLDQPARIALGPGVTVTGIAATEDGAGIPAARVRVLTHISGMVSSIETETLCDAGGGFSVPAVLPTDAAVTHRLCVDASGYGAKSYVEIEVSDRAGATTDLGRIVLPAADQSLGGVVVDANDRPVANIPIFLRRASRDVSQPERSAATDEAGRFRFHRICKGPAHLQAGFSNSPEGWASLKTESGQQDIRITLQPGRDVENARIASALSQGQPQYARLTGKQLSQVKGLESLVPADAVGKPLLILFMDQQQRPSRAMVLELVKRTDLLKEKGIEVVVVQVAPMDRADFDKWLADQKALFKARMLEGGFDRQHYAWGVQSLPWLILTDAKHEVIAEGFALSELDSNLQGRKP